MITFKIDTHSPEVSTSAQSVLVHSLKESSSVQFVLVYSQKISESVQFVLVHSQKVSIAAQSLLNAHIQPKTMHNCVQDVRSMCARCA